MAVTNRRGNSAATQFQREVVVDGVSNQKGSSIWGRVLFTLFLFTSLSLPFLWVVLTDSPSSLQTTIQQYLPSSIIAHLETYKQSTSVSNNDRETEHINSLLIETVVSRK